MINKELVVVISLGLSRGADRFKEAIRYGLTAATAFPPQKANFWTLISVGLHLI